MPEPAVVNASPLILLTRAGHLELLRYAGEVLVPGAVASEIGAYGEADPTAVALRGTDWLRTVQIAAMPLEVVRWDLGPGESEVLAWRPHQAPLLLARRDESARGYDLHHPRLRRELSAHRGGDRQRGRTHPRARPRGAPAG